MSAHPHGAHPHGDLVNEDVHHEESDINVRAILWFVAILTAITIAIQIAMWGMFKGLAWYEVRNEPYVTPLTPPAGQPPPEPRLQTTPWTDLRAFRADQQNHLNSYGWVDEKLGVARIPIAKAKQLLLERGLPVRPELAADLEGTHIAATGDSSGGRSIPAGLGDKSRPAGGGGFVSPDAAVKTEPAAPKPPVKPGGGS
jgi:hypothetical protein